MNNPSFKDSLVATEEASSHGSVAAGNSKLKLPQKVREQISDDKLPHVGVVLSAAILLFSVFINREGFKPHVRDYCYSIAGVAIFITVILPHLKEQNQSIYVSYLLFLWTFIGALVLTCGYGPFDATGNGYFTSWSLVYFSSLLVEYPRERFNTIIEGNRKPLVALFVCSLITLLSSLTEFEDHEHKMEFRMETVYATLVSMVSLIIVTSILYSNYRKIDSTGTTEEWIFPCLAILCCLWMTEALLTTFRGPFYVTGNGYFASWGGVVASVIATRGVKPDVLMN